MSRCGGPLNGLDDAVRLRGQSAERMRGRETCIFAKIGLWAGYQLQVPTTFVAEIPTGKDWIVGGVPVTTNFLSEIPTGILHGGKVVVVFATFRNTFVSFIFFT